MAVVVDIGSHKTLIGLFDDKGSMIKKISFMTSLQYDIFLIDLKKHTNNISETHNITRGIIAIDGKFDFFKSFILECFNLPWKNISIVSDLEKIFQSPFLLQNSTALAALFEANNQKSKANDKLLYVSIGNSINHCLISGYNINHSTVINKNTIAIQKNNQLIMWDKLVSGKSFLETHAQKAKESLSQEIWQNYAKNLAIGLWQLRVTYDPNVIIIGGSIGLYYDRYFTHLIKELSEFTLPSLSLPSIKKAIRPYSNVLYGSFLYINQEIKLCSLNQ